MRLLVLTILMVGFLAGCQEDPQPVDPNQQFTLAFVVTDEGTPVVPGGNFQLWDSVNVDLDIFRMHLARISFRNAAGTWVEAKDVVLLEADKPATMRYVLTVPKGSYTAFRFGVGLDSVLNASDPVSFPSSHPLSAAKGMYWSWAMMYRFILTEGRATTGGTQVNYAHHPGRNDFYRTFTHEANLAAGATYALQFDLEALYDGPGGKVNPMASPSIHTTPADVADAIILMNNAPAAFSVVN
jgi:hypothetical protein